MNPWDELMAKSGSQAKAAETIGLVEDQYCRYRKRERTPRPPRAADLAERFTNALGRVVTPMELLFPEPPVVEDEAVDDADLAAAASR